MAGITWLHLSDWHQKGPDFDRKVVRDALLKDLRERQNIDPSLAQVDFIVFSGDLAFSGQPAEYEAAWKNLLAPVLDATQCKPERLFIVPGNHDLDRDHVYEMLPPELQKPLNSDALVQKWLSSSRRPRALEPFAAYCDFVNKYLDQPSPEYASVKHMDVGGIRVALLGLNSAWMCARNKDKDGEVDDERHLVIGEPQIYDPLNEIADTEIKIAVMHHPIEWLAEFDRTRVKSRLGQKCHFILRGHEHEPQVNIAKGTGGDCVIIPAGACYDRRTAENPRYTNAYNWVHLDLATGQGVVYMRQWCDQQNVWIEGINVCPKGQYLIKPLPKELGNICTQAEPKPAQPEAQPPAPLQHLERERTVLAAYLEALVRNNTDLDPRGIKTTKAQVVLPLDEIYVGLQADRDRPDVDRRVMQEELDEIKRRLEREEDPKERERQYQIWSCQARTLQQALEVSGPREELSNIVQSQRQVVILGDPGSGKTTLMRYLTLRFARAILADLDRIVQPQDLWEDKNVWRLPDLGAVRLPILLRISHYAEARQKDPDLSLVEYLPHYFAGLQVPYADDLGLLLRRFLEAGRCIVLLDGLDEIIDPADRRNIATAIGQFAGVYREKGLPDWLVRSLSFTPARANEKLGFIEEDIEIPWDISVPEDVRKDLEGQLNKKIKGTKRGGGALHLAWELLGQARYAHVGNRFVVTSRIAGYHFAGVPGEFEHYTIRRMNPDDIKLFLEKWCPAVERRIAEAPDPTQIEQRAQREIDGILDAIEKTPGVRRMAENPLLLRILAVIHRNEAHLPQRRVELYETATVTLLRDWHLERGTKGAVIDDVKATSLLGPVAFHIHKNYASGFLSKGETEQFLAGILACEHGEDPEHPSLVTREAVRQFLDTVREHSGLFVERGEGLYGFMHLTFEEYFTARHLVSSAARARTQILELLHQPRWREPTLLAVGSLSKQFYNDTHELLKAILGANSPYEQVLHRDLLFAAACVGDSVNVAPILRQEIASRLLSIYCDRRGAGRYRLLQSQAKDALLTLCNDQGDAAVEAALAATLTSCDDRLTYAYALEAVDFIKARTPSVASALASCTIPAVLLHAQKLLHTVQARLPINGNGPIHLHGGWNTFCHDPALARLLGAMWRYGQRDRLSQSLGVGEDVSDIVGRELSLESTYRAVGLANELLQQLAVPLAEPDRAVALDILAIALPSIYSATPVDNELRTATRCLIQFVATLPSDQYENVDASQRIRSFMFRKGIPPADQAAPPPAVSLDQAVAQFQDVVCGQERLLITFDLDQALQSAGLHILGSASAGNSLVPAFAAASIGFHLAFPWPDGNAMRSTIEEILSEIRCTLLSQLRSAANGLQYQEIILFLCYQSNFSRIWSPEDSRIAAEAVAIAGTDLEGADSVRRGWALQALTTASASQNFQFSQAQRALLLGLLDGPADQATLALDILFGIDLTPDLLAWCWQALRPPNHPLTDAIHEKLETIKYIDGSQPWLVLLDEGRRDAALRTISLALLRKLKWHGAETFAQAMAWIREDDVDVRHQIALLLADEDRLLATPRNALIEAIQERLLTSGLSWARLSQDASLVRLLGGLWLHNWDEALTQMWVAHSAKPYINQHSGKFWHDFQTYPASEECICWLLEKAEFGRTLIPIFQNAAARLSELEGVSVQGMPQDEHIATVQQEISLRLEALMAQSDEPLLLRAEAELLVAAVCGKAFQPVPNTTLQAALEEADNREWGAALFGLANQKDQQPIVLSEIDRIFTSGNRERCLLILELLVEQKTLGAALAEKLASRYLGLATDVDEALAAVTVMLHITPPPAGLYSWLCSLVSAKSNLPLAAWLRQTLAAHGLAPEAPPAALASLLVTGDADAQSAASLALLTTDLTARLVEVLLEVIQSPDDQVRIPGIQQLHNQCGELATDGSTQAVPMLLRFYDDADTKKDGYLITAAYNAINRINHRHPFWVEHWLDTLARENEPDHAQVKRALRTTYLVSDEVINILCSVLENPARPPVQRRAAASTILQILRNIISGPDIPKIQAAFIAALNDPDTRLRRGAALTLQWVTNQDIWLAAQVLLHTAKSEPDCTTRVLALRSAGRLLYKVRDHHDVDISKNALFRWLEDQAKIKSIEPFNNERKAAFIQQLSDHASIQEAPDADAVLDALSHPDLLGLPGEKIVAELGGSRAWNELLESAHQEWLLRHVCLEMLPHLPEAVTQVESLLADPAPEVRRAAACALARFYHGNEDRPARLSELLPETSTLLQALLDDIAVEDPRWQDYQVSGSQQIAAWVGAQSAQDRNRLIAWMIDNLESEVARMEIPKGEDDKMSDDPFAPFSGHITRLVLTTVLAELSEQLTYRAFTSQRDLANVVSLFSRTAVDQDIFETRRFAIRVLGNLQQMNAQVADVFFAACKDFPVVYKETRAAVDKFKVFGSGSLERLTAAVHSPSITVAYHAALLLGELGVSRSEDLGRVGRQRVADELVQLLDDPLSERIIFDFSQGSTGKRIGPLYDVVYEALLKVVAGPDAPVSPG